jgi:SAM-dependent methyltransferase
VIFDLTWQVKPQIDRTLADLPDSARIVDLGAGGRRVRESVVAVDVLPAPGVDIVADIHSLPLEAAAFDLAICTGTLNLCRDPRRVLAEVYRVLKPNGLFHLEVGMFQPYNPEPEDYWRFTSAGLKRLLEEAGFQMVRSGVHIGPFSAVTNNAVYLIGKVFEGSNPAKKLVRGAAQVALSGVKFLDALLPEEKLNSSPFAYGIYAVAKKPPA